MELPLLGLVAGSAVISSVNPCSVGVLALVLASVLGKGRNRRYLATTGLVLIFSMFLTYVFFGLGLALTISSVGPVADAYITISIGVLMILAGIIQVKDFFWYGKGPSMQIPTRYANKIHKYSSGNLSIPGAILLGVLIAIVEMPCTGAPYLAIVNIVRVDFDLASILLLITYCLLQILPLVAITLLVSRGVKLSAVIKWKEESKGTMRLFIGLLLIVLGWILLSIANGTVNFK